MGKSLRPGVLSLSITPKSPADGERLARALPQLVAEDATLDAVIDTSTGEVILRGIGELQLEIVIDRLSREFSVSASVSRPQVSYKETLTRPADGEMKYSQQTDGRRRYAHVKIHVSPGAPETGYVFVNEVVGGAIPTEFIKPIDEGIKEALTRGVLSGYPIDDVRVGLRDGSYHDVDSSETAFRIAGSMAFEDAARKALPVLLEPIMRVEVTVPREYKDDVAVNLSARRAQIQSHEDRDGTQVIQARVPLAEMFGYSTDLRSRTQGRASYAMEFDRYERSDSGDLGGAAFGGGVRTPRDPKLPLLTARVQLPPSE